MSVASCYGQARIGFTKQEISSEFKDKTVIPYNLYDENYITIEFYFGIFTYYFDCNNVSYSCNFRPNNTKILHQFITKYDLEYEILGLNEWRTLDEEKINIELVHNDDYSYYYFNFKLFNEYDN